MLIIGMLVVEEAKANPPDTQEPPPLPGKIIQGDFTFTQDISAYTLVVQKDNIVIDGGGFSLEGAYSIQGYAYGIGISVDGKTNVTIKNLTMKNFGTAILIQHSNNISVFSNTVMSDISISGSSSVTVKDNQIPSTVKIGYSVNNSVINNHFDGHVSTSLGRSHIVGVCLKTASHNLISQNVISNAFRGILIENSSENNIIANTITGSNPGIHLEGLRYNKIGGSLSNNITGNFLRNNLVGLQILNSNIIMLSDYVGKNLTANIFSKNDIIDCNKSIVVKWDDIPYVTEDQLTDWHKIPFTLYGNCWGDYNGKDIDGDGVGDKPYNTTDPFYFDNSPLMVPTYIRNATLATPKIQTIDELRSEEIASTNSLTIFADAEVYALIISFAIGLGLVVYFKKRKR